MDDDRSGNAGGDVEQDQPVPRARNGEILRNLAGFWLLGLCNNFAYVIMLSAAQDILESGSKNKTTATCQDAIIERECAPMSTGSVLLADIIPSLFIKLIAPLFIHAIPFGTRHAIVVLLQAFSYILVALGKDVFTALTGVVLASFASGLGEISYLSLASNFKNDVVSAWSSGTGGAGIFGALAYAVLTDPYLLGFTPRNALLSMLLMPAVFALTYWRILLIPAAVHRVNIMDRSTYFVNRGKIFRRPLLNSPPDSPTEEDLHDHRHFSFDALSNDDKWAAVRPLLRFMVPLMLVYFGEYFINQGMFELLIFDCAHGFGLSPASQYRWYQVLYQLGVFVSRSSSGWVSIAPGMLPILAGLQLLNATLFTGDAWLHTVPHISLLFIAIFYEGLLGGAAYVNTFRAVHKLASFFQPRKARFITL
ncbi:unnamed protein product, partial [Mesorhabditis spiculigera]